MKRILKTFFWGGFGLLWVVVFAMALEVYARREAKTALEGLERCAGEFRAANLAEEQRVTQAYPDPGACAKQPARNTFAGLDEAQRNAFVQARSELAVIAGWDGAVKQAYYPAAPREVTALGEALHGKPNLVAALQGMQPSTALTEIEQALLSHNRGLTNKELEVPALGKCLYQLEVMPCGENAGVFIRPSIYAQFSLAFRKNMCCTDVFEFHECDNFRTNSLGWRSPEVAVPKPPGVVRIICIGGSTTAEGRTNALTYPHMLETRLRAAFGTDRIEVVNCGVHGMVFSAEEWRTNDYAALDPDIVVHYNLINDVRTILMQWISAAESSWDIRVCYPRLLEFASVRDYCGYWLAPAPGPLESSYDEQMFQPLQHTLEQMGAKRAKICLCSFAYPHPRNGREKSFFNTALFDFMYRRTTLNLAGYAKCTDYCNRRFKALCEQSGWFYVPVAEQLQSGAEHFIDICHLNPQGIERKADIIFASIKDLVAKTLEERRAEPSGR